MASRKLSRRHFVEMAAGVVVAAPAIEAMAENQTPKAGMRMSSPVSMVQVRELRCEYRREPLGIETTVPRFGWQLAVEDVATARVRGQRQTGYRVRVASRREALDRADLWDSGHVASDQSVGVVYAGHPLRSGDVCWWQAMAWDRDGVPTGWSEPARFSVGRLGEPDWQGARWIGMASAETDECPQFRRTFTLATVPETALASVGSIGFHELYVNGRRVGDGVLAPSVSDLRKRALYVTYDIRPYLKAGKNVVALWAAAGWGQFQGVNPPVTFEVAKSPLCIAHLQFGTPRDTHAAPPVVTDSGWRCARSDTRHRGRWTNSDFGGDFVDAGKSIADWNAVGFDDSGWEAATVYAPSGITLSPDPVEPNRRCQTVGVRHIEPLGEGRYRVEMAEIFTGWLELTIQGSVPGTKVTVKASSQARHEVECNQINEYVVGPGGQGVFCERFSYHQYHYVTIEGLTAAPAPEQIVGYRIGNDLRRIGGFDGSNPLLKAIYDATIRTYVNLTTGGMTVDCPHRERLGYGGDGHTSLELALDHFDTNAYLAKWARDWADTQEPDGDIPHTAPTRDGGGGPAWSGFIVTLPWAMYESHGDHRVLEQSYPFARRYLAYLQTHVGADGLVAPLPGKDGSSKAWYFLGDWAAPHRNENSDSPEASLFNNCYYRYILGLAAQIADLVGKPAEAAEYRAQAESLRQAIDRRFYDAAARAYLDARETHCILPLIAGVPSGRRAAEIEKTFENELRVTRQGHLDTGLHGTYFMTKYLTERERSDLVFLYATRTTFPSYGELLAKGYTTWPEYWGDADSKTHGCLNGIGGWFQRGLAGIRPDARQPGYRHALIRPALVGDLTWVEAHHDGPYGRIAVRWERSAGGDLRFDITVPPNATADVYLPNANGKPITESGHAAASAPGVKALPVPEQGISAYRVLSGKYVFVLPGNA